MVIVGGSRPSSTASADLEQSFQSISLQEQMSQQPPSAQSPLMTGARPRV